MIDFKAGRYRNAALHITNLPNGICLPNAKISHCLSPRDSTKAYAKVCHKSCWVEQSLNTPLLHKRNQVCVWVEIAFTEFMFCPKFSAALKWRQECEGAMFDLYHHFELYFPVIWWDDRSVLNVSKRSTVISHSLFLQHPRPSERFMILPLTLAVNTQYQGITGYIQ